MRYRTNSGDAIMEIRRMPLKALHHQLADSAPLSTSVMAVKEKIMKKLPYIKLFHSDLVLIPGGLWYDRNVTDEMYRQTPTALIAARENEALTHGQVLYGLVKPTKDMDQVESTAAMVNVIPKKRIYRMEKLEELDLFMVELMKRPLVLQPSAHIGRGLAVLGCSFYTTEEKWLLLVNQNHPKVESRIKMAVEAAKKKMIQGLPFVVEISFNKFLKRVYLDRLTKAVLNKKFTFIDFEGADLSQNNDVHLEVEDLLPSEVERRTVSDAQVEWSSPALRVIMPEEI
ncbi:hypothetical protein MAR_006755 [Mya arenaria]|uniref:Uncharacterized protein n=1 Tax=Mya arenaria TaxID=6604 RepID=A0ABY7DAE2_MYAAR|nr:hypothetical protein MAR_006755 [Mya arenaria]